VEVTGDASRGVTVSDGMVLLGCQIISNGRLGVGGGGNGITITGSTISDNGLIVADRGWEAGGIKTVADNVLIDDNRIEGNGAPGIWTDVDATDVVVADNHLSSNTYGLEIEISRDVTIMANSITATRKQAVLVVASKGVSVVGNTLTDNFGGVLIGGATRIGPSGVRLGNVRVNHNLIANSGVTGLHQTPIPGTVVHFDRDTYRGGRFQWDGRQVTFAQFRMFGQEAHGAFSQ
jgi:hypothetical protein